MSKQKDVVREAECSLHHSRIALQGVRLTVLNVSFFEIFKIRSSSKIPVFVKEYKTFSETR